MGLFSRKKTELVQQEDTSNLSKADVRYQTCGTPLVSIGKGDITKPYIDSAYVGTGTFVRFGWDNLYPSLIDQMYFQSPLHASLIEFQINASIGGGYEIVTKKEKSPSEKVKEYTFVKQGKLKTLFRAIAQDIKMHRRTHIKIYKKDGVPYKLERIIPSKVRYNSDATIFWISNNWLTSDSYTTLPAYSFTSKDEVSVYSFIDLECSPGQDVYPLDKTISAFNFIYLDGQSSTLLKKNIEKSIFGSLVIRRPKAFESKEEFDQFKKEVVNKEGEVVPVLLFAADGMENLPEVESFPANQNDKVFEGMYRRIDEKICQAHSINPVLFLEGTGGLGSGSDITAVYPIWEKNVVIPFRLKLEEVMSDILSIFDINGEFVINNFQIINSAVADAESVKMEASKQAEPVAEVNDNLKGLSAKENMDMMRIIRDYNKGRLNEPIATARLMAYGLTKEMAAEILNND